MLFLNHAFLIIALIVSAQLQSSNDVKSHMLRDIDRIEHLFEVSYAPAEWKKEQFGLDLDLELARMREMVSGNPQMSIKRYQQMVKELCFALRDYHVTADFYSTEYASLPFNIQSAEGRYFITKVVDYYFSHSKEKNIPEVGDEIIAINGVPVKRVFEEFMKKEIGENVPGTDLALAELYMTHRMGSMGHQVPSGAITFELMKKGTAKRTTYKTQWNYFQEEVPTPNFLLNSKRVFGRKTAAAQSYDKLFITSHYLRRKKFDRGPEAALEYFGARQGVLPRLGRVDWESDENNVFNAYIFYLPNGKKAGYLRIATYLVEDTQQALTDLEGIVEKMESEVSVLLIDQMNNPGGYVNYLYGLLSRLTPYPVILPRHRVKLTQEDIFFAVSEIDYLEFLNEEEQVKDYLKERLEGIWVTPKMGDKVIAFYKHLLDCWRKGKRLSDPICLYGIEVLEPHPVFHFSKPILMLVNGLDFSGGDFMPAILQDNKRALIMGTRTAGAGGYIQEMTYPNLCGVEDFCLTASIAERPDGRVIENLGVEPDILYNVSVRDLRENYTDYKTRILEELIKLSR